VRLQNIADEAQVSRATVSLALRNHQSIPVRTRQRIQALAKRLGYRPNPLVSALMTYQRTTKPPASKYLTLAMVVSFSRNDSWKEFLSEDLLISAARRAREHGFIFEEFWLGDLQMNSERLGRMLARRSVPGIILSPLPVAPGNLQMDWSPFAAVAIGYSLVAPALHRVTTNRSHAMHLAVQQTRRMGYQRPGLALHVDQDARVDHQWAATFLWEQQQMERARRVPLFIEDNERWQAKSFARWFNAYRPDVVLSHNEEVLGWLEALGLRVPRDVGFVHLWNPDRSGKFAGIYHDPPAIGEAAVDFLVGMIQRNERGVPAAPQTLLMEAAWQDGASLKPSATPAILSGRASSPLASDGRAARDIRGAGRLAREKKT
jgi:LacI family transcriptional regulator